MLTVIDEENMTTVFDEYAALQRKIKDLQAQSDALKAQVMAGMPDKKHIARDGTQFSISWRKTWQYSAAVTQAEETLKGMKKAEEKAGDAIVVKETPVLSVRLK